MDRRKALMLAGLAAAGGTTSLLAGCGGGSSSAGFTVPPAAPVPNIVDLAKATPSLSILVEAVVAADLVATLSGAGPFTVFAPNNDAFAALLTELNVTKAALLADKPLLTAVLTYHVLGSKVEKAGVPIGKAITTVQRGVFKVEAPAGVLTITDGRNRTSKIIATDVQASNGVVHIIDKVILPANKTIVETAQGLPSTFSLLVEAVVAAGLVPTLSGTGPFTVFAPTDAAFAAALTELGVTKAALFGNVPLLTKILTYHVVSGRVLKADIPATPIATVQGETFTISLTSGAVITDQQARKTNITATDVFASNGVIHVIDRVILTKTLTA
jgi:uncharacterized surface protein with fasciclin (FAS1) repeats